MSGHSKWHSIRHKKGALDAKRGKIFTRHANLITIAARSGGDPDMNPTLRLAIDNAKKENVPNQNIERAVKRGTGELKDGSEIAEMVYEGYAPGSVAVLVECLSDNKNRTYTNLRTIFNKNGGNLGNSGSVSWMFERKGVVVINSENTELSSDDLELLLIESGADDIKQMDSIFYVYTDPKTLPDFTQALEKQGVSFEKAEREMVAKDMTVIDDLDVAQKIIRFLEAIEEDPDVSGVYSSFDLAESIKDLV